MKDSKNDTHRATETLERVRSFLDRQDDPERDALRRSQTAIGACLLGPNRSPGSGPPFLNLTQHYLKNYFGPSAETLEALPTDMFVFC